MESQKSLGVVMIPEKKVQVYLRNPHHKSFTTDITGHEAFVFVQFLG